MCGGGEGRGNSFMSTQTCSNIASRCPSAPLNHSLKRWNTAKYGLRVVLQNLVLQLHAKVWVQRCSFAARLVVADGAAKEIGHRSEFRVVVIACDVKIAVVFATCVAPVPRYCMQFAVCSAVARSITINFLDFKMYGRGGGRGEGGGLCAG